MTFSQSLRSAKIGWRPMRAVMYTIRVFWSFSFLSPPPSFPSPEEDSEAAADGAAAAPALGLAGTTVQNPAVCVRS